MDGGWRVVTSREYRDWRSTRLTDEEREAVQATVKHLEERGPALGRPLSDHIKRSRYWNMKELIPPLGNIRILYIFDPERRAVLLLGGDKTNNWDRWYKEDVPLADAIYARHLGGMAAATASKPTNTRKKR